MMNNTKRFGTILPAIAGLLLACSGTATAGLMQVNFFGTVDSADQNNTFGLNAGDTVTGSTTYDGMLLTGIGDEFIGLGTDANGFGGSLTMNIGTTTFVESDDIDFFSGFGFPELQFLNGMLVGFEFLVHNKPAVGDEFDTLGTEWNTFSLNDTRVAGTWTNFSDPFAVLEPGTLSLLGIGCLGLLARRRKAA
ncbi:PEP-CTERM sorting domain-containing protein [Marinobacter salinisoli]|uniref:PEP-CTERM sorting domain-containing protein n=1 Tax=Marinobacter salinisoli TaxID=2769486 RepID=A0ABX7MU54_9GAMM|nr:PEP-CTERM sorting domain-containing protein [Marinobacter salinisoli]QSP95829.1 PEP-CTERM sorting domain-containing protein [Marinobacter salinisoli]